MTVIYILVISEYKIFFYDILVLSEKKMEGEKEGRK